MVEAIFPPSSNWFHAKIISTREDGSVAYGSQNHIFVMEVERDGRVIPILINAHRERVRSVAFCPTERQYESQDFILSSSDDGFVKIWNIHSHNSVIGHNSHSGSKEVAKVVCAAWSPYNPQYAVSVAENDTAVLWNTGSNTTSRFHFSRLKPSVVECSYHSEKIIGVGSKSGMVFIIQLTGKGEILHRLRGHDKEIQGLCWSPMFDITGRENVFQKCYLATSSQEKEIIIWKAEDGSCLSKIPLPKSAFLPVGEQVKWDPATTFIPLYWGTPHHLYTSSKWGELICCDPELVIQSEGNRYDNHRKQKGTSSPWKLVHRMHSSPILAIAGFPLRKKDNMREVDDWLNNDESRSFRCVIKRFSPNGMGFYEPTTLPKQGLMWTIGKDQKLVAIGKNAKSNPHYYFNTINGHAFVAEVLPIDPHVLAIGAGDGKIRKWNVTEVSGEAVVFGQKINDRVYSLAWHPAREIILGFGTSEGRVGLIDVFSLKPPSHFMMSHSGKVYRLAWGPHATDRDPCPIDKKDLWLYSVGGHKILCHYPKNLKSENFNIVTEIPDKKYVDIIWRSDFKVMAVGSKKGYIYILKYPKMNVVCNVLATSKCVMSLTWHPALTTLGQDCSIFRGYITFASVDNENVIKVYNFTEVEETHKFELVAALKGHLGYIQYVSWNPHISGRLVSCSSDYSVRIWDVTACTQLNRINVSYSVLPLFCIWSPIDPDILIVGNTERMVIAWRISSAARLNPVLRVMKLEKGATLKRPELLNGADDFPLDFGRDLDGTVRAFEIDIDELSLASRNEDQKTRREEKMFKKVWNPEANLFQSCYEMLKSDEIDNIPDYNFTFLKPPNEFFDHIDEEDDVFKATNNWALHYQLSLWKGNLNEILEEHIVTGQLDDYLMSIAPFVSHRMWQRACDAYAKVLAEKGQYRKAATYLLAIHKLSDAIDMLVHAKLFLEAICVARCRVPDVYPLLPSLIRKYADWLAETGNSLKASECYIYLNEFREATSVLAKKNQPEHLSLAALASKRSDEPEREAEYSYRALVICLEIEKYELAARICSDHPRIKKLYLLYKTHQMLIKLDARPSILKKDLISQIKELTRIERDPELYASLQYMYDRNSVYNSKKNMFVVLTHELLLACCASGREPFLTHIIKALNTASKLMRKEKNDVPILYKLITWLDPEGPNNYLTWHSIFGCDESNITPKMISLRGYLCLGIADYMRYVLHQNLKDVKEMQEFPPLLDKLMKYGLDKDAFSYFRDQVYIKLVEKEINEAYKRKNEQRDNGGPSREAATEGAEGGSRDDAAVPERAGRVTEDDIIITLQGEKMNIMKTRMKRFEDLRVSAPNPAVVYCLLREVLESGKESDSLNKVERMFEELELE